LAECLKRRRVIPETDSDEEEGGGVSIDDTRGSSSIELYMLRIVCVHAP
jgi:hypothetical protein